MTMLQFSVDLLIATKVTEIETVSECELDEMFIMKFKLSHQIKNETM